jgi:hypothetical protein
MIKRLIKKLKALRIYAVIFSSDKPSPFVYDMMFENNKRYLKLLNEILN